MEVGEGTRRVEAARRYIQLLRDHIDKESGVLFPLTDAVLEASALDALARAFEDVEVEQGAGASIEHAEAAVERLEATLAGARATRRGATS
jgi:hemerythrin-like domain-containing protein